MELRKFAIYIVLFVLCNFLSGAARDPQSPIAGAAEPPKPAPKVKPAPKPPLPPQPNPQAEFPFKVPPGFVVELVAGPPLVEHPMHASFDDRGRLFVAESLGVNPFPKKGEVRANEAQLIRILEDTKGNGHFDKSTVFADKLNFPEGVLWHDGKVWTASPPSLWRLEDKNGVAGARQEMVTGFPYTGVADDLHGPTLGPDGWIYWCCGRFPHDIRRPGGPVLWKGKAPLVLRCRPDGADVEVVCGAQGNPVKQVFSSEGEIFSCGTFGKGEGGRQDVLIHCIPGAHYPQTPDDFFSPEFKHTPNQLPPLVFFGPSSASGVARYRSETFGPDYRNNLFSAIFNTRTVQRHILERDGATFKARSEDFLSTDNPHFRPSDVIEDADGSLLVFNTGTWSICCEAFRAGGQPKVPGAIYRVRRKDAPAVADPRGLTLSWDSMKPTELVALMDDGRFVVRDRAVQKLAKMGADAVPVLQDVVRKDAKTRIRRNAVWALTRIPTNEARQAVRLALADTDASVRQTAVYSVGLLKDQEAAARCLELLEKDTPPIRREAATALSRMNHAAAVPALLNALKTDCDLYLDHSLLHALIQIGDRQATLPGLKDPSPGTRRGALVALDQMDGGQLTQDMVAPLLDTDNAALFKTALAIVMAHSGWGEKTHTLLRNWLALKEVPVDRHESLRGIVRAFPKDPKIQAMLAEALDRDQSTPAMRVLLLETIAQALLLPLPENLTKAVGRNLESTDEKVLRQAVVTIQATRVTRFDESLAKLAADPKKSNELRLVAASAVAPRLQVDSVLFDFLIACLDKEMQPLTRLEAASCLGNTRLDDSQLESLAKIVAETGPLEMPRLVGAYERSKTLLVGQKLVAALDKAPGLQSLSTEGLTRLLRSYPQEVKDAARSLFKKIEVDTEKMKARLTELEPVLKGGDVKNGRKIFFGKKASCFACHAVKNEGGQIGPDLTKIGANRSGRDLLVAIAFPSAGFARGFEPFVVTTLDGKLYPAGVIRRESPEAIYLVGTDNKEIHIPRSEIEIIQPGKVSIMPDGLDNQLSRQDLSDLIAFLMSLK